MVGFRHLVTSSGPSVYTLLDKHSFRTSADVTQMLQTNTSCVSLGSFSFLSGEWVSSVFVLQCVCTISHGSSRISDLIIRCRVTSIRNRNIYRSSMQHGVKSILSTPVDSPRKCSDIPSGHVDFFFFLKFSLNKISCKAV